MGQSTSVGLQVIVLGAGMLGCTTTLYEGPRLSPGVAATIESSDDAVIRALDGKDVTKMGGRSARYIVPPGPHLLRVGAASKPGSDAELCLVGDRGRRYRTAGDASSSRIVELDEGQDRPVIPVAVPSDCAPERLFPDRPGNPAASPQEEVTRLWSAAPIAPHVGRRPFVDVSFDMTLAGGGDEVAWAQLSDGSRQSIHGGTGFLMSVNTMFTPFWLKDAVGFGAGGEIGFKVWDITASNGQITLKRYPVLASVHLALRMSDEWFLILAGGVEKDLGVEVSGSGIASDLNGTATSNVAPVGRVMFYGRYSERWATMVGVIVSRVRYSGPGGSLDASSVGGTLGLTLAF